MRLLSKGESHGDRLVKIIQSKKNTLEHLDIIIEWLEGISRNDSSFEVYWIMAICQYAEVKRMSNVYD